MVLLATEDCWHVKKLRYKEAKPPRQDWQLGGMGMGCSLLTEPLSIALSAPGHLSGSFKVPQRPGEQQDSLQLLCTPLQPAASPGYMLLNERNQGATDDS